MSIRSHEYKHFSNIFARMRTLNMAPEFVKLSSVIPSNQGGGRGLGISRQFISCTYILRNYM